MVDQQQHLSNQRLLIASNIAIFPLLTSFGGIDAGIFQLYATGILGLGEDEIGIVIGVPILFIPLQLLGIHLVNLWGSKRTLIVGFSLFFFLLPLTLIIPSVHGQNDNLGFALLCLIIVCMNVVHNVTKGVAFQPMVHRCTRPDERGWFLSKMRLSASVFNLIFWSVLSLTLSARIEILEYAWIIVFLMTYCVFGGSMIYLYKDPIDKDFSSASASASNFWHEIPKLLDNRYRLLINISISGLLISLPLFVTYLSLGLQLDAGHISQLMIFNIGGSLVGVLVCGKLIDRLGFMRVLRDILLLLVIIWPLWLFVQPMALQSWSSSLILLGLIATFNGFLQSGLKMSLLVGLHNTVTNQTAVSTFAFFDIAGVVMNSLIIIFVGFYLNHTLEAWKFVLGVFDIDSYKIFCLFGSLSCLINFMMYRNTFKAGTRQRRL